MSPSNSHWNTSVIKLGFQHLQYNLKTVATKITRVRHTLLPLLQYQSSDKDNKIPFVTYSPQLEHIRNVIYDLQAILENNYHFKGASHQSEVTSHQQQANFL